LEPGRCPAFYIAVWKFHAAFSLGGSGMTAEDHRRFLEMDFSDAKLEELADIGKIRIDRKKSVEEKKRQYLNQVKNPYLVKVGDTMVKIRFANNGVSFEDAFENLLLMA
jgi:hypothetical protein